jgi:hypothetical protein
VRKPACPLEVLRDGRRKAQQEHNEDTKLIGERVECRYDQLESIEERLK